MQKIKILFLSVLFSGNMLANDQSFTIGELIADSKSGFFHGLGRGVGNATQEAMKPVLHKMASPFLSPISSLNSFKLALFMFLNNSVFNYQRLVWLEQYINNLVKDHIIDLANGNNKILRLKQQMGAQEAFNPEGVTRSPEEKGDSDVIFGVERVLESIENIRNYVEYALPTYEGKSSRVSMFFLRPYSSKDLEQIVFTSRQILNHCDHLTSIFKGISTIDDIEAKKETIKLNMKAMTNLFGSLVILIDPDTTFATQKGLQFSYDGKYQGSGAPSKDPRSAQMGY